MAHIKRFNSDDNGGLYTSDNEIKIIKNLYDQYLEARLTNKNGTKELIQKIYQTADEMINNDESKIEAWINAFEDEDDVMVLLNELI